jgi:hypothetical protein
MKSSRRLLAIALILTLSLFAASLALAQSPGAELAQAANNFLAALTPDQKAKTVFELKSDERVNWHFIPRDRKGLSFKELSPAQRLLGHALLSSVLSQRGLLKATTIMSLEQVLLEIEQGRGPTRDPELYYLSLFGTPGKDVWGWRVEGHHLSLNFLVRGDTVLATTPSFLGVNPGEVRSGPRKGLRVLAVEEDLGRQLARSLDENQRKLGIIATEAPKDIITAAARNVKPLEPTGLPAPQLNPEQRELLKKLIEEYIYRHRAEVAQADRKKIEAAGWQNISFAWAGSLEPGQGHYYRIQGPTFLLEYDNTQNNANHIHTVWRDFENDFGEDTLRKHYEQTPHSN